MVKLNKIYTRTGDTGETGLADGSRRKKYDLRIAVVGDVDEANSAIGVARQYAADVICDPNLARIQQDLFDLGADVATPETTKDLGWEPLRIASTQVARLEVEIDQINEKLSPLDSFILPGGSMLAAQLHVARTVTRRAERLACELADREAVNPEALKYLNRLSDFLFVLSRAVNNNGASDVLWVPGVNR